MSLKILSYLASFLIHSSQGPRGFKGEMGDFSSAALEKRIVERIIERTNGTMVCILAYLSNVTNVFVGSLNIQCSQLSELFSTLNSYT